MDLLLILFILFIVLFVFGGLFLSPLIWILVVAAVVVYFLARSGR